MNAGWENLISSSDKLPTTAGLPEGHYDLDFQQQIGQQPVTCNSFLYRSAIYASNLAFAIMISFHLVPPPLLSPYSPSASYVSLTALSMALAIYSTFPVFAPAILILPFFVI